MADFKALVENHPFCFLYFAIKMQVKREVGVDITLKASFDKSERFIVHMFVILDPRKRLLRSWV